MPAHRFVTLPVTLLLLALSLPGPAKPPEHPGQVDLKALRDKEELVLTIGNRLAVAAANRCAERGYALGLMMHDIDQYNEPYRDRAAAMFLRTDLPAVLAVAQDGAAAQAGVRPGDAVLAVNAKAVTPASGGGLQRVEAVLAQIGAAAMSGPVRLTLARGETERTVDLLPPLACAVRFQVRPDASLNAMTNGWLIEVTTKLIDFAEGPDELAAVLAHELAHVILDHRARTRRMSRRESRDAELQADLLSVRLAADAGFRASAAADFWTRMRADGGIGPSGFGRHPADSERLATVTAALDRLETERQETGS